GRHRRIFQLAPLELLVEPLEPLVVRLPPARLADLDEIPPELLPRQDDDPAEEVLDELDVDLAPVDQDPQALERSEHHEDVDQLVAQTIFQLFLRQPLRKIEDDVERS